MLDHWLCFVHLQRNIRKYMTKADATELNKELNKMKLFSSFDEAVEKFQDLCSKIGTAAI
jgi:transposase-like protein